MRVVFAVCCGLDVHKDTVVASLRRPGGKRGRQSEVRTFGTTTVELLKLSSWLAEAGCTHAAMESAGEYWKPVWNVLEGAFEVLLVNAQHIKNVPGRKTDVKDAEWIAQLLECGLLRASFIPPKPIRELRDLTRARRKVIETRARAVNRVQKVLGSANVKLGSVVSDVMGASGRAMLKALVAGERDPAKLASLAQRSLKNKQEELQVALSGRFTEHHAFLIERLVEEIEFHERQIEKYDRKIQEATRPFDEELRRLQTVPGVARRAGEEILAELGADMGRFASDAHAASWVGVCPGNHESAGKHKSGRTRKGNRWLRTTLVQCGWAASHTKGTYPAAQYRHLARRRGKKKALVAVAHSLLVSIYHILKERVDYKDLGPDHLDRIRKDQLVRYYTRRLEELGHPVTGANPPSDSAEAAA